MAAFEGLTLHDPLFLLKKEIMEKVEVFRNHKMMAPYIGKNYLSSKDRILVIGYVAEVYAEDLPSHESAISYRLHNFYSSTASDSHDLSYPDDSYPARIIMDTKSSSFTLRKRIKSYLPSAKDINDIAFYYYIPRLKIKSGLMTRIGHGGLDQKFAFDTFVKLIPLFKPTHVLFYGRSAYSDEVLTYLKENNVAYDTITLRSDCIGSSSLQSETIHGLKRLLHIKEQIQNNLNAVPPILQGAIDELLDEINFMENSSARSNSIDAREDQKRRKLDFLKSLTKELTLLNKKMLMKDVALLLNANGFKTARGGEFEPYGQGIYKLIMTTVQNLYQSEYENDRSLANEMELRYAKDLTDDEAVSAALMSVALERKYGFKSTGLNMPYDLGVLQEERKRVFGDKIPSEYMPINEIFKSSFGAPPCV